jgi:hypothetical protein
VTEAEAESDHAFRLRGSDSVLARLHESAIVDPGTGPGPD